MENKIRKIWYLIIIILVCLSAIFYLFRRNLSKDITPVKDVEIQEITTTEDAQSVENKQEETVVDTDVAKVSETKKQEIKKSVSATHKQEKKVEEKKVLTPQEEEDAIKDMQRLKEATGPNNRSEVVEIRHMYKTNTDNNVFYRGVWYNIKTKVLTEQGNQVETTTESKE